MRSGDLNRAAGRRSDCLGSLDWLRPTRGVRHDPTPRHTVRIHPALTLTRRTTTEHTPCQGPPYRCHGAPSAPSSADNSGQIRLPQTVSIHADRRKSAAQHLSDSPSTADSQARSASSILRVPQCLVADVEVLAHRGTLQLVVTGQRSQPDQCLRRRSFLGGCREREGATGAEVVRRRPAHAEVVGRYAGSGRPCPSSGRSRHRSPVRLLRRAHERRVREELPLEDGEAQFTAA